MSAKEIRLSPKGTRYTDAEISSVCKGQYGQWRVTVLLDNVQYETTQYYDYTKKEAVALTKAEYGIG